jgi:hypothetical protein
MRVPHSTDSRFANACYNLSSAGTYFKSRNTSLYATWNTQYDAVPYSAMGNYGVLEKISIGSYIFKQVFFLFQLDLLS